MAQKLIVEFVDDIDGTEAKQTLTFASRGVDFEIDLSDANAEIFDRAVAPFVAHARRVGSRKRSAVSRGAVPDGLNPAVIRSWAADRGIEIGVRGRIPQQVIEQYRSSS